MYAVTDVTLSDRDNGIFLVTVGNGTHEVTLRVNRNELGTSAGRKKLKTRFASKLKELSDQTTEETALKTSIEAALA